MINVVCVILFLLFFKIIAKLLMHIAQRVCGALYQLLPFSGK